MKFILAFLILTICRLSPAQGPLPFSLSLAKLFLAQQPALPPVITGPTVWFYDAFNTNSFLNGRFPTIPDPRNPGEFWTNNSYSSPGTSTNATVVYSSGATGWVDDWASHYLGEDWFLIPLLVESNHIYSLSGSFCLLSSLTQNGTGVWIGFDDGQFNGAELIYGPAFFLDATGTWTNYTYDPYAGGNNFQTVTNGTALPYDFTNTFEIDLDTHGALWKCTWWFNGLTVSTSTNYPAASPLYPPTTLIQLAFLLKNQSLTNGGNFYIKYGPVTVERQ